MIELGWKVRDMYSGFTGIAVGRTQWIYGCVRYSVEPGLAKDGTFRESVWIDEQRLQVVKKLKLKVGKHFKGTATGGPRNDPSRPKEPRA